MKLLTRIVTGVVLVLAAHGTAHADSTWVLTSGTGAWLTGINWNNGVPGATGTTTNSTDIATFSTMTATGTSVVDSNRNVGGIIFSGTSTFGIHLTTGTLRLTNGGTIQTTSAQGAHDDQVRSRVSIQGNGGSATFFSRMDRLR
jgi:hypothetical protein